MLQQIREILKKTNDVNRSAYVWNVINACVSGAESPFILLVLARTNGLEDSGVFSIAFAVAELLMYLGLYGFRVYQSSDVNGKYSFEEYYGSRFISCGLMFVVAILYCIYGMVFRGYTSSKLAVVLLICILKGIEAFEDVLHGRMQQVGRLDIAVKASCFRFICEMVSFATVLVIAHNLVIASTVAVVVSMTISMLTSYNVARDFCKLRPSIKRDRMREMLIDGFPLFVSLFLNTYINNELKYAIDGCMDETTQAYFNMIFMPAFMIQLIAHFIFNPIIKSYAEVWQSGKIQRFKKLVLRQCFIIFGLTLLAVVVALTIGIPVLSLIFGTDLSAYKYELVVVAISGGMLAYSAFFNSVITIIRLHKVLLYTYVATAITITALSRHFVLNYGIIGAIMIYGVIMTILAGTLALIIIIQLRRVNNELHKC